METKRKKHHRVYRRVPEEMRLEIAKDYYLGQMPQVEIVRKYELCETTVREILRKFAAENNKSALLMGKNANTSESEEIKALRKEVLDLKKKLYDETMRADFYDTMIDVAEDKLYCGTVVTVVTVRKQAFPSGCPLNPFPAEAIKTRRMKVPVPAIHDLRGMAPGVYMLRVATTQGIATSKVIVR